MKKIVASLCLVGLGLTHGLNIGIAQRPWGNNQSSYDLSCDGAHGTVKYYVNGVPNGVSLNGSTIVISADAKPGTYTITITAVDDIGQTAQKTVSLTIVQGSSTSGYDNGAFGGQLGNLYGGANTFSGQGAGQGAGQGTGQGAGQGTGQGAGQGTGAQLPGQGSGTSGSQTPGQGSGTPSSQTPGSQNPNDSSRLNELISTFSSTTATTTTTTTYPNNRYPTPNLPTNPDPNLYNPTPATIASQ